MPQTAAESSPSAHRFAGLLASLATARKPSASGWDDELADDIATISYERALRTHHNDQPPATEPAPDTIKDAEPANSPDGAHSGSGQSPSRPGNERLKTASITIRLSEQECAQLRERAAEAGLTLSAYLRSCTLEVESLRAQVKETLAQLRRSPSMRKEPSLPSTPPRASARRMWRRLWPFGSPGRAGPASARD